MFSAESVDGYSHIGADTSAFSKFYSGCFERASLNAPEEFSIERVLMSTELYAVFRALLLLRPVTTISLRPMISSICMSSMVVWRCSPIFFSMVCIPDA